MNADVMTAQLAALSRSIDEHPANAARDPEAATWGRIAKISEEAGEVIDAMIGLTGQNPRKGRYGHIGKVEAELLDVAVTALAAVEHINRNAGVSLVLLSAHLRGLCERVNLVVPE